jgi:hypothetical protein
MTEAQHQKTLIDWTLMVRGKYPVLKLLFAIPNGGRRDLIEARHLKEQGVKAGVCDLFLPVSCGKYHGLFIELKTDKGVLSDAQSWWIEELTKQGYFVKICRGYDSARRVIEWYLSLT